MRKPVVVVSALPSQLEAVAPLIAATGCELRRLPSDPDFGWSAATIGEYLGSADALVGIFPNAFVGADALDGAPHLRVITSPIIGTETFDVEACTERGIIVGFGATPENVLGVAEANVMLIAALRKNLVAKMAAAIDGSWYPASGVGNMVRRSTVGVIGFGAIGRATAKRLAGWECRVVASDPHVDSSVIASEGVEPLDLDELLSTADVVVLAVTLTAETRGMMSRARLGQMKAGAFLINTARGGLVDEGALLDALEDGHLAGAALDTWVDEGPGSHSVLRGHPQVIGTGHNVGHSRELYASHPPTARDNTIRALNGALPLHVRNPEVIGAWRERSALLDRDHPLTPLTIPTTEEIS